MWYRKTSGKKGEKISHFLPPTSSHGASIVIFIELIIKRKTQEHKTMARTKQTARKKGKRGEGRQVVKRGGDSDESKHTQKQKMIEKQQKRKRSKQTVRKSGPKRGIPVVKQGGDTQQQKVLEKKQKQQKRKNNAGRINVDGHYAPKSQTGGGGGQQMGGGDSGSSFSFDSMDASEERGHRGGVDQLPPSQMLSEKEQRNYNMGLPYFTLDRQPHSNVKERNDSSYLSTTTTMNTTNPSCMNVSEALVAPSNTSVTLYEQREPSSSMGDNHSSHSSSAPTSLALPSGRGRGAHRTQPASMTSQDSTLLNAPSSILGDNKISGLNDQKLPSSTSIAPLASRGRGTHRTKPASMISQDSLLHVPDRVLSTFDMNAVSSNRVLKSCMKNEPKSTNTCSNVAIKTEETKADNKATATDMSFTSMASADNISAKHKAKILSLLPINNGDNEGASMNFIRKTMEPCGLQLNRRIFEKNLLDSIEIVDNDDNQRRYFVRTAESTTMPYKPWYDPERKSGTIGGKNKKKNDQKGAAIGGKKKKAKDPNAPKRPSTAFKLFLMFIKEAMKDENPDAKKNKSIVSY